jgi:hypothetical protein
MTNPMTKILLALLLSLMTGAASASNVIPMAKW